MSDRNYLNEFPDFDYDLPTVPGFEDASWHNDACPCLRTKWQNVDDGDLTIWCDYADPAKREFSDGTLYHLTQTRGDGETETLCATDDLDEVIAAAETAFAAWRLRDDGRGFGNRA